jgi:RUNX transcription factor Runt
MTPPGSDYFPLGTTMPQTGIPPPPPLPQPSIPPSSAYLTQFGFTHTEFLPKTPFLPYDLHQMRANGLRESATSGQITSQSTTISTTTTNNLSSISSSDHMTMSSRLSPASSRNSSSSPPSMMHLHNGISQKINSSFDMNSTAEQSSEESDEEHIDVVKSAFVPILRPHHQSPPSSVLSPANIVKLEKADSTVRDQLSPDLPPKSRNDSKAPQLKKHSIVHETAPTGRIRSPETILKITATVQKTVWRPY